MTFLGKMNYQFRKRALEFILLIHYNHWCISRSNQVIQHFRKFSFWLVFPYWSSFGGFWTLGSRFQHFGYPKDTSLHQTTSFEPSYVKIRCELWSVGELTKQEEKEAEEKSNKIRESGTVYFTAPVAPIATKFCKIHFILSTLSTFQNFLLIDTVVRAGLKYLGGPRLDNCGAPISPSPSVILPFPPPPLFNGGSGYIIPEIFFEIIDGCRWVLMQSYSSHKKMLHCLCKIAYLNIFWLNQNHNNKPIPRL